jgi:POT family proton-dependent oligopeptide transporter
MNTTALINDESDRSFLGHPRGLAYISFTEAWERFSYYGMQTLLVLYMVGQLLLPGHVENIAGFTAFRSFIENMYGGPLSTVALASAIFGLYTGFVYLTPIAGGLIADKWLGKTTTITIGALLMALGHFLMAFDVSFLIALSCLLIGVGCFKGNLASQVSELYAPEDMRRADAFQIYFLFINAAVIAAPLIAGTLGEVYGWHYGFGAAGIGMLISLVVYLSGRKWLPVESNKATKESAQSSKKSLTKNERRAIYLLVLMLPILALGSIGNQQIFNSYLLWVPGNVDLVFFGRAMPTTWLITVDAVVSVSSLFLSLLFWRWWAKRFTEPSEINKMTIGLALSAAGIAALAFGAMTVSGAEKAHIGWVLAFEVLNSFGFANLFPVGIALYARAAPKTVAGTMMGIYYLHLFMCNNLVGWLGGLMERMSGAQFWFLHVGLVGISTILLFVIARFFGHYLVPENSASPA